MAGRLTRGFSGALVGVEATEVEIEVNEGAGDPKIIIVGLPDAAVRESRDRVYTALLNSGLRRPGGRTTINLAPADLKKEGPSFDLPIAVGMASLRDDFLPGALDGAWLVGELALNGAIRPIKGALSLALEARRRGRRAIVVPEANAAEAAVVDGIQVFGVSHLREALDLLRGRSGRRPVGFDRDAWFDRHRRYPIDLADVKGQPHVKRALEVAVAGGHNLLLIGPPGTGKSMLAQRVATIMPSMTEEEAIEATKIHSIAGLLEPDVGFLATRPFRSPHHTISDVGLLGGGANPHPGEVSLAHHGVLFLDELPEFRRSTLEVLRQPIEDGRVTVSRAAGTMTFPARFMMVAAMNPCGCGYHGDPKRECRCTPNQILKYRQRISGPLLDRIDLHVEVPLVDYRELRSDAEGESSAVVRARVEEAREIQRRRFRVDPDEENEGVSPPGRVPRVAETGRRISSPAFPPTRTNAAMTPREMRRHCALDAESNALLEHAMKELNFSARAHDRILKVARTLADLNGAERIEPGNVLEAIQYRTLDRTLWA